MVNRRLLFRAKDPRPLPRLRIGSQELDRPSDRLLHATSCFWTPHCRISPRSREEIEWAWLRSSPTPASPFEAHQLESHSRPYTTFHESGTTAPSIPFRGSRLIWRKHHHTTVMHRPKADPSPSSLRHLVTSSLHYPKSTSATRCRVIPVKDISVTGCLPSQAIPNDHPCRSDEIPATSSLDPATVLSPRCGL